MIARPASYSHGDLMPTERLALNDDKETTWTRSPPPAPSATAPPPSTCPPSTTAAWASTPPGAHRWIPTTRTTLLRQAHHRGVTFFDTASVGEPDLEVAGLNVNFPEAGVLREQLEVGGMVEGSVARRDARQ